MQFSQFKNSAEIIKFCRFENKFCCRFRQQNVFKIKLLWMDIRRNSAVMATLSAFLQYEKNWDKKSFKIKSKTIFGSINLRIMLVFLSSLF
jgi:hypothetical protein